MRLSKIVFLFIASLAISSSSFAQGRQLKKAEVAYDQYEFHKAMVHFKRAYSKSSDRTQKIEMSFKLAECARRIGNYRQAESYYKRTIKMRYDDPIALLYLAMMQRNLGKFDDAINTFTLYSEKVPEDIRAQEAIESCELALEWTENPTRYAVSNMKGINSKNDDRMPAFANNDYTLLMFTTARKGVTGRNISDQTGQYFTDVWLTELEKSKKKRGRSSNKKSKPKWSEPLSLGEHFGTEDVINTKSDEGAVTLNERGNLMYFTRAMMKKNEAHVPRIYSAIKKGGEWEVPLELSLPIDSNYMVIFPCLSPDEKILYFVSDMPGGEGDFDIWMSEYNKRKDVWAEPVNLGPEVNTDGPEIAPFVHKDGTLFFASKGHVGMGGFDIFRATKRPSGQFGKVKNMKFPINSSYDDFGIIFSGKDAMNGFYTSNRRGGRGGDDIYEVKLSDLKFKMEGILVDTETSDPLQGVSIHIEGSDGSSFDAITNKDGFFNLGDEAIKQGVEYEVTYTKDLYVTVNDTVTTQDLTIHDFESTDEGFLYTIAVDLSMKVYRLPVVLPQIEYDLGSADLREMAMKDLDKLVGVLETNPDLRIQLRSHTDFRSGDDFNLVLSQKRADACVSYLIEQGVDATRLVAVGMGESEPLTLQDDRSGFAKGDVLSQEFIESIRSKRRRNLAHQMNRRTDFKELELDPVDAKKYGSY
ncbi:MAG: peptidoglycan-associated lipoprotein [Flavobacteriales bacterium]|jgi:peptidoglycan-associated lipoprotein|tara:strand:+ start:13 stop:2106 length:2094 start_codon:yes stop_codon:yes gene_type:complete